MWRWALALALNGLYFMAPIPVSLPLWAVLAYWGIGALAAVCIIGKMLYDTLFYDRFRS